MIKQPKAEKQSKLAGQKIIHSEENNSFYVAHIYETFDGEFCKESAIKLAKQLDKEYPINNLKIDFVMNNMVFIQSEYNANETIKRCYNIENAVMYLFEQIHPFVNIKKFHLTKQSEDTAFTLHITLII